VTPKGWVVPTNGKVLRIAVTVKTGFSVFVNASNPSKIMCLLQRLLVYCIDVFNEALSKLPYSIPYEFYLLSNYSYNDLV
jgi:glutamate receptor, ionotropic, plant